MSGLIEELCAGARLSVVLRPDNEAIGSRLEAYDECYGLPFFYVEDGKLSGITRPAHLIVKRDKSISMVGFCYSPSMPIYSIIYPSSLSESKITIKINASSQYEKMEFRTLPPGEVKYRFEGGSEEDLGLPDSIVAGNSHYGVMGLPDGRVIGFPIDIAYVFPGSGKRVFRAESYVTSAHVFSPARFQKSLSSAFEDAEAQMAKPEFSVTRELPGSSTFLHVRGDGTFETMESEVAGQEPLLYDWLTVLAYP